jgi:cytosine/creatinine deaminase
MPRTGGFKPPLRIMALSKRHSARPAFQAIFGLPAPLPMRTIKALIVDMQALHPAMDPFLQAAIDEARLGLDEGGIPIGSVLVHDGRILGRGHNRRVQSASPTLHGEMDALENAGRLPAAVYRESVLYTTLSPCAMCSGAILLYGIPRVVIGENRTFLGEEELLRSRGVQLDVLQDEECIHMMQGFITAHPELWNEDIGE